MPKMPKRREDIELTDLYGDSVCYHPDTEKAICLDERFSLVLKHCDGKTERSKVSKLLGEEESNQDLLDMILGELSEQDLLAEDISGLMTRQQFLLRWGMAAAVLPVIASVTTPAAAQTQSKSSKSSSDT